jgi:hypothetical protein
LWHLAFKVNFIGVCTPSLEDDGKIESSPGALIGLNLSIAVVGGTFAFL